MYVRLSGATKPDFVTQHPRAPSGPSLGHSSHAGQSVTLTSRDPLLHAAQQEREPFPLLLAADEALGGRPQSVAVRA